MSIAFRTWKCRLNTRNLPNTGTLSRRCLSTSCRNLQQQAESFAQPEYTTRRIYAKPSIPVDPAQSGRIRHGNKISSGLGKRTNQQTFKPNEEKEVCANWTDLTVDGQPIQCSPVLLRDLCECSLCVDRSTKQKLFNTAEIPSTITARAVAQTGTGASLLWDQDIPGYDRSHTTELDNATLRSIAFSGLSDTLYRLPKQTVWNAEEYSQLQDIDYEAYMQDDASLFAALQQLQSHGLMFLTNVPGEEKSVSTIAERIGAVKNTFYGYTWDVRSVPQAKNVAYTSQDLGFHMDLLYMHQPPHLQFLHCMRSSSIGGASLFTDSYKAAADMFRTDIDNFCRLAMNEITFHYNHPSSNLYQQIRPVFEVNPFSHKGHRFGPFSSFAQALNGRQYPQQNHAAKDFAQTADIVDFLSAVSWAPPFQGPMTIREAPDPDSSRSAAYLISRKLDGWLAAARSFNELIHRSEAMYERMMKPGECVLFDNRRVLHARRAFDVGDAGKERWLRGAYLDKDPFVSKLQVLGKKFSGVGVGEKMEEAEAVRRERYYEAAASV